MLGGLIETAAAKHDPFAAQPLNQHLLADGAGLDHLPRPEVDLTGGLGPAHHAAGCSTGLPTDGRRTCSRCSSRSWPATPRPWRRAQSRWRLRPAILSACSWPSCSRMRRHHGTRWLNSQTPSPNRRAAGACGSADRSSRATGQVSRPHVLAVWLNTLIWAGERRPSQPARRRSQFAPPGGGQARRVPPRPRHFGSQILRPASEAPNAGRRTGALLFQSALQRSKRPRPLRNPWSAVHLVFLVNKEASLPKTVVGIDVCCRVHASATTTPLLTM